MDEFKADGVVYENMKFCEFWSYEKVLGSFVLQSEMGVPCCTIEKEYALGSVGQLRTRFQAFVESLEIKKDQRLRKGGETYEKPGDSVHRQEIAEFDPKWQAGTRHGRPAQPLLRQDRYRQIPRVARRSRHDGGLPRMAQQPQEHGPDGCKRAAAGAQGYVEYRWIGSYLGTFCFIDRLFEGFRGPELRIAHLNMHAIVQSLTKKIALVLSLTTAVSAADHDR